MWPQDNANFERACFVGQAALSPTMRSKSPPVRKEKGKMSGFEDAQKRVKLLKKTPTPPELLELYALYKQGTSGDVSGKRPGMLDMRGRAKFDAWSKKKGMSVSAAEEAYVGLVAELEEKYGA